MTKTLIVIGIIAIQFAIIGRAIWWTGEYTKDDDECRLTIMFLVFCVGLHVTLLAYALEHSRMKYTATIENKPDGGMVIALAIKCTKQDLADMVAVCEYPHELSVPALKKYYEQAPASRFLQALAQFCSWGEDR